MTVHHHLSERLATNCGVATQGVAAGLVPSVAWLTALSPAVGGNGGLTVGGLRCALLSSDAAVRRVAEQVLGCVQQPEWRAAMSLWQLPPASRSVSPCALSTGTRLLMAGGALQCGRWPAGSAGRRLHQCLQLDACRCALVPSGQDSAASCEAAGPRAPGQGGPRRE
jgi:hypothetical protein